MSIDMFINDTYIHIYTYMYSLIKYIEYQYRYTEQSIDISLSYLLIYLSIIYTYIHMCTYQYISIYHVY